MLKKACLTFAEVGRTCGPLGQVTDRPLSSPAVMRKPKTSKCSW